MARPLACRSEGKGVKRLWSCLADLTTLWFQPRGPRSRSLSLIGSRFGQGISPLRLSRAIPPGLGSDIV